MPTVFSRISSSVTNSRRQVAKASEPKAKSPLNFPPRRLSDMVQRDPLSGDMRSAGASPHAGPGVLSPNVQEVACEYTSTLASGPCTSSATLPCPLHKPAKGHLCVCDMRFCNLHAGRVVGLGQHEGQCRASALPRATQAPTLDFSPSPSSSQGRQHHPDPALVAAAANAAAKALVYTTLTKIGGPRAVLTVER